MYKTTHLSFYCSYGLVIDVSRSLNLFRIPTSTIGLFLICRFIFSFVPGNPLQNIKTVFIGTQTISEAVSEI